MNCFVIVVIQPPVPCGTKIDCHAPCQRPPPSCGHPKPSHTCHEEPDCPPCPYLTEKACQCDKKKLVKNVRCSQPKVSCGSTLLACGAHRCSRQCHPAGQCESCDRECLKPRKHCGHGCQQKCHAPSACRTEEPCEAPITIQCICGRITQQIKCTSCDARPEGNQERGLKCNDDCILFQRNMAVANALQITKPSSAESQPLGAIEWSSRLLNFFGTHALFARAIERQLAEFLKSELSTRSGSSKNSLIISTFSKLKQAFLLEFVANYRIKPDTIGEEPRFTVKLVKDSSSCLPSPLLSQAHANHPDPNKASAYQDKSGGFSGSGTTLLRLPGSTQSSSKAFSSVLGERDQSATCAPNQILAILFKGVFGHDHQSLTRLIESALDLKSLNPKANQIKVSLNWVNDEDVLFRVTAGTRTDFEELQTTYKSLVLSFSQSESEESLISDRKKFYQSIVMVKVHLLEDIHSNDEGHEDGLKIKKIEPIVTPPMVTEDCHQGWKSSASASSKKLNSKLFDHSQQNQNRALTNRFSSLLASSSAPVSRASTLLHQSSSTSTAVGHFSGGVISGGFNRPPIAVLAPIASSSRSLGPRNHSGTLSKQKVEEEDVVDDWETAI
ncbi:hypothetical protein PTTG_25131 [Puccinia triticina 1-1 BBBD Race 1]|uniref:NF-X1-type domain-containing protein n=1 Tax=Puccinia triticina (isolate 1-1 / race 1 (BBBD)) TaxID=630390 RepID=A0A180H4V4_PUCT1|nr:hypothetical protein PTTG_25131 [Puccinia triticina 1-1 BBBD Race 1]